MRTECKIATAVSDAAGDTALPRRRQGRDVTKVARHAPGIHTDPIDALLSQRGDSVLAVITEIDGPSYRPLGAVMAVFGNNQRVGTLSSGCVEKDIALRALETLRDGTPTKVRYGRGSPFMDIKLPCGGGLEVLLLPRPDRAILTQLAARRGARLPSTLSIDMPSGSLSLRDQGRTGAEGQTFDVHFPSEVRILVFGKGPEAATFAALVQAAGFPNILFSPDAETLDHAALMGCETRHLAAPAFPADVAVDARTAVVLFFHDHDWEPAILSAPATRAAFYVGAQGSRMARDARNRELKAMGVDSDYLRRIHGPIGLLPSVRDARTLAISVLAEVLAVAAANVAVS